MLFAIGAGPQVAAVSSFDRYPPEVSKLQRVGALLDPDIERILSLRPDLCRRLREPVRSCARNWSARKIPVYVYSHAGLADVLVTLRQIGERVGHGREAADLARSIQSAIDAFAVELPAAPGRARSSSSIVKR
jgi:iron complex transport system substrate-binding protein